MKALDPHRVETLLSPYCDGTLPPGLADEVAAYVELILKWNGRTNLTAVRDSEELVQRQVGESLFAARLLETAGSLLDFGSGAGFPGIPIQMLRRSLAVTLAESQGKKAAFLREAGRVLHLPFAVWSGRVQDMQREARFDAVVMRAVDRTEQMIEAAAARVAEGGRLIRFVAERGGAEVAGWTEVERLPVPLSQGFVVSLRRA